MGIEWWSSFPRSAEPAAAALALGMFLGCSRATPQEELGKALFHGEQPLRARMVGHTLDLPLEVVRCSNCHGRAAGEADAGLAKFAPSLDARRLKSTLARRGGPPTSYDLAKFCRVLREGIDPASVVIQEAMPRYSVSEPQCQALWAYLTHT